METPTKSSYHRSLAWRSGLSLLALLLASLGRASASSAGHRESAVAGRTVLAKRILAADDACFADATEGRSSCALDALQRRALTRGPFQAGISQEGLSAIPVPLHWLHICKCGTSFMNTLLHQPGICPGFPEDYVVDGDTALADMYSRYPNMEPYCPGSFENPWFVGNHVGLGDDYTHWKGHLVTFLRDPQQRIISGWYDDQQSWPFSTPASSLKEYANILQGCAVRMFTRSGGGEAYAYADGHAPNICGGPEPVTDEETSEAVDRLWGGFAFVGLTDKWNLSTCLFHTMYGGPCRDSDFQDTRMGEQHHSVQYDAVSLLGDFRDEADGQLFSAGVALFTNLLHRYNVSEETCGWCYTAQSDTHFASHPEEVVHEETNLCTENRLLPELYVLGAQKCGTTSLYENLARSGVRAALYAGPHAEGYPATSKEFHFFDCSRWPCPGDAERWSGARELWLEQFPSCPEERSVLGDFTPHNLRLVPLPEGTVPSWKSQGLPPLPETLVRFYGKTLKQKLKFVVLLGEPLQRFQSAYYDARGHNFSHGWGTVKHVTFEDSLRASLQAANATPAILSDVGLWPSMYSWHLRGFLRHFAAAQFIVVPKMAYLQGGGTMLCKDLSRMLALDLCQHGNWKQAPHSNSNSHPPLQEDVSEGLRADFDHFIAPEHDRLLEILASAHRDSMHLFNYTGALGSKEEINSWLQLSWN